MADSTASASQQETSSVGPSSATTSPRVSASPDPEPTSLAVASGSGTASASVGTLSGMPSSAGGTPTAAGYLSTARAQLVGSRGTSLPLAVDEEWDDSDDEADRMVDEALQSMRKAATAAGYEDEAPTRGWLGWSEEEDAKLENFISRRLNGERVPMSVILRDFPNRTESALGHRISVVKRKLVRAKADGTPSRPSSPSATSILPAADVGSDSASNSGAGKSKAPAWSAAEDASLRALVTRRRAGERIKTREMVPFFPGRTEKAISQRLTKFGRVVPDVNGAVTPLAAPSSAASSSDGLEPPPAAPHIDIKGKGRELPSTALPPGPVKPARLPIATTANGGWTPHEEAELMLHASVLFKGEVPAYDSKQWEWLSSGYKGKRSLEQCRTQWKAVYAQREESASPPPPGYPSVLANGPTTGPFPSFSSSLIQPVEPIRKSPPAPAAPQPAAVAESIPAARRPSAVSGSLPLVPTSRPTPAVAPLVTVPRPTAVASSSGPQRSTAARFDSTSPFFSQPAATARKPSTGAGSRKAAPSAPRASASAVAGPSVLPKASPASKPLASLPAASTSAATKPSGPRKSAPTGSAGKAEAKPPTKAGTKRASEASLAGSEAKGKKLKSSVE